MVGPEDGVLALLEHLVPHLSRDGGHQFYPHRDLVGPVPLADHLVLELVLVVLSQGDGRPAVEVVRPL